MTGGNGGFPASAPPLNFSTLSSAIPLGAELEVCNTEVLPAPNDGSQREPSNPMGWERLLAQLPSPLEPRNEGLLPVTARTPAWRAGWGQIQPPPGPRGRGCTGGARPASYEQQAAPESGEGPSRRGGVVGGRSAPTAKPEAERCGGGGASSLRPRPAPRWASCRRCWRWRARRGWQP